MGCHLSLQKLTFIDNKESLNKCFAKKETIDIIQSSWVKYREIHTLAEHGTNMVIRLFMMHSDVRYLWEFAKDLKTEEEIRKNSHLKYHGKRLMEMIGVIVRSLNNLEVLDVLLFELGSRHNTYGINANHFVYIQEAFIYVFMNALGTSYTLEVAEAWDTLFEHIFKKMQDGMLHSNSIRKKILII